MLTGCEVSAKSVNIQIFQVLFPSLTSGPRYDFINCSGLTGIELFVVHSSPIFAGIFSLCPFQLGDGW